MKRPTPISSLNRQGFTLVEILVVVAIIGVVASIGAVEYSKFRVRVIHAHAKTEMATIFAAERSFFLENNVYTSNLVWAGYVPSDVILASDGCPGRIPHPTRWWSVGFAEVNDAMQAPTPCVDQSKHSFFKYPNKDDYWGSPKEEVGYGFATQNNFQIEAVRILDPATQLKEVILMDATKKFERKDFYFEL